MGILNNPARLLFSTLLGKTCGVSSHTLMAMFMYISISKQWFHWKKYEGSLSTSHTRADMIFNSSVEIILNVSLFEMKWWRYFISLCLIIFMYLPPLVLVLFDSGGGLTKHGKTNCSDRFWRLEMTRMPCESDRCTRCCHTEGACSDRCSQSSQHSLVNTSRYTQCPC